MATIQVFENGRKIGDGPGLIDTKAHKATIETWDDKAGLRTGMPYTLQSQGKTYNANCLTVSAVNPVATFDKVS